MRHLTLDELKKRAKPPRRVADVSNSVRKARASVAKLKALIPVVANAARQHPDI